jgi:predicted RNA polymerase sigma factor
MASRTVAVAKFAAPTVFSSDAIPTVDTMRKPLELLPIEQVGLCRELISVLEAYIKARKDEYKVWSETHPGVNPPGWKVVVARGPSKIDTSRQQEIRDKLKSTFGFTDEELDRHMSAVDLKMVAEFLITSCGHPKSKAPDAVKKALEPFMVSGAPVVRWTKAVRKQAATGSGEL